MYKQSKKFFINYSKKKKKYDEKSPCFRNLCRI